MNVGRISSSPDLLPMASGNVEDSSLEGISTNVKLMLKLLQDHQEATQNGNMDERKQQRIGGIMTILDDVKTRLQKSQSTGKKSKAELRRCNTDLKPNHPPKGGQKKEETLILDEKERLKRDLNLSFAAQKRLGIMCASIGKEKEIISTELRMKVEELNEAEQHVSDLRAQNERLSAKIQACVAEHKESKKGATDSDNNINFDVSQQRNKELSEQLFKSLEGYKMMKRKLKEVQEERNGMQAAMEQVRNEVSDIIPDLKKCVDIPHLAEEQVWEIEDKIASLEHAFKKLDTKTSSKSSRDKGMQKV